MKLILTQEVSTLGSPGDVVEVKDGYGRNYLMPRGLAIRWTKGAEKQIDSIKQARSVRDVRDLGQADEIKNRLETLSVTVPAQAGSTGRLFGAVSMSDIVAAVKSSGGPDIDKRRIQVANPIKTLGAHQVTVKIHDDVLATVNLEVVSTSATA
jgi:large subunit ribosomal protein L9